MKKLTAIIIIVLPVFLLISISLAGRIVNTLNPIRVESVAFIDRNGTVINRTDTDTAPKITISVGQTINFVSNLDQYRDYSVRVLPSGASNQGVLFSSQHLGERLEFVTENQTERQASQRGHFRAIRAGTAIITMRSDCDSRISAQITIRILSVLDSVQIEWTPTELFVGDQVWLDYSTSPAFEAGRIRHQWSSSHPSLVSIDNFGRLIVLKYDEDVPQIVITLSVVEVLVVDVFIPVLDVYDTVDITISSQMPILAFLPPPSGAAFWAIADVDTLDLTQLYMIGEGGEQINKFIYDYNRVSLSDISFSIDSGSRDMSNPDYSPNFPVVATINGSVLTIIRPLPQNHQIVIRASVMVDDEVRETTISLRFPHLTAQPASA